MTSHYALLSLVYMMSFVILFDRMHFRHQLAAWLRAGNLMSPAEVGRIQAILSACEEN